LPHCDEALKLIGQALVAYRDQNGGQNPPSLEALTETVDLSPWLLVCPGSGVPFGESSYKYRGGDLDNNASAELIVAYDKKPWHKGRRNVLFADGSVQRFKEEVFEKTIDKDNQLRSQMGLEPKPE